MRPKQTYDSMVVFLYSTGREHLLPVKFRRSIPYATIAGWRRTDYSKFLGHQFRRYFDQAFENLELRSGYEKLRQTLWTASRSWLHLRQLLLPIIKEAGNDKSTQKKVLDAINTLKSSFGLKRALKLFGVNHSLYRQWMIESQFDCFDSYTAICTKRHPHQLAKDEVLLIRKMLKDREFDHWPIVSVACHGLRTGKMVASLYSWYKYARLLGITKKPVKKQMKTEGLIATYPNEYWHVDTTQVALIDGKRVWIAFVMDNYSRMILGFHVMENRTFAVVKEALKQAITTAQKHFGKQHSKLVSDGGTENYNKNIHDFLRNLAGYSVEQLCALKDIQFSNSPVEMINRTVKGRYLNKRKFESVKALSNFLNWTVNDYNVARPHYALRPRTPHEVYYNIPLSFDLTKRKKHARTMRLQVNKNSACLQCTELSCKKTCETGGE